MDRKGGRKGEFISSGVGWSSGCSHFADSAICWWCGYTTRRSMVVYGCSVLDDRGTGYGALEKISSMQQDYCRLSFRFSVSSSGGVSVYIETCSYHLSCHSSVSCRPRPIVLIARSSIPSITDAFTVRKSCVSPSLWGWNMTTTETNPLLLWSDRCICLTLACSLGTLLVEYREKTAAGVLSPQKKLLPSTYTIFVFGKPFFRGQPIKCCGDYVSENRITN